MANDDCDDSNQSSDTSQAVDHDNKPTAPDFTRLNVQYLTGIDRG